MPFIDVKLSKKISDSEKDAVKTDLGRCISTMHKPESYLMVGIDDGYSLYFAGNRLSNGAFVSVSVFGAVSASDSEKMTAKICEILHSRLNIDGGDVYVTYSPVENWGWDGGNF